MEQSEMPKPQRDQVDKLLTRMKVSTNNPYFTQYTNIKMQARRDHGDNFIAAIMFIGSEISENIKVKVSDNKGNKRYRSISASKTHRGRGRARGGRDRGGRGRANCYGGGRLISNNGSTCSSQSTIVNGVDIGDPTWSFTQAEMDRLGPVGRTIMFQQRERANYLEGQGRGDRGGGRGNRGGARQGRYDGAAQQQTKEVSQITEGTGAQTTDHTTGGNRGGRTGNRFGRGRHVGAIRIISRAKHNTVVKEKAAEMLNVTNLPKAFNIQSRNEMDTMADTSCAGTNWTPIYFTGETVDVAPFAPDHYKPFKQVPVATCATMMTTQSGREWLVIGNEMLYFGEKMDRSLINPNQIRMNGIRVDDNPTEEVFGISAEGLFIPFKSKGTTVYWDSRAPTFEEIDDLDIPHLVFMADEPWDPQAIDM